MGVMVICVLVYYCIPIKLVPEAPFQGFQAVSCILSDIDFVITWAQYQLVHSGSVALVFEHCPLYFSTLYPISISVEKVSVSFFLAFFSFFDIPNMC
jgi:hypothetical protein